MRKILIYLLVGLLIAASIAVIGVKIREALHRPQPRALRPPAPLVFVSPPLTRLERQTRHAAAARSPDSTIRDVRTTGRANSGRRSVGSPGRHSRPLRPKKRQAPKAKPHRTARPERPSTPPQASNPAPPPCQRPPASVDTPPSLPQPHLVTPLVGVNPCP